MALPSIAPGYRPRQSVISPVRRIAVRATTLLLADSATGDRLGAELQDAATEARRRFHASRQLDASKTARC